MDESMESYTNFLDAFVSSIEELLKSVGELLTHSKDISKSYNEVNDSVEDFLEYLLK